MDGCQCGRWLELLSFWISKEEEAGACPFVNTFQHHAAAPTVITNTRTLLQVTPSRIFRHLYAFAAHLPKPDR